MAPFVFSEKTTEQRYDFELKGAELSDGRFDESNRRWPETRLHGLPLLLVLGRVSSRQVHDLRKSGLGLRIEGLHGLLNEPTLLSQEPTLADRKLIFRLGHETCELVQTSGQIGWLVLWGLGVITTLLGLSARVLSAIPTITAVTRILTATIASAVTTSSASCHTS